MSGVAATSLTFSDGRVLGADVLERSRYLFTTMSSPTHHSASLGTPEGRKGFFLHLLEDSGQSLESRVRALDEFFLFMQREAYQAGWNDGMRPRVEPAEPRAQ